MRWTGSFWKLLCVAAMTFGLASAANATLVRTFISNSGNDSNASSSGCIVTAPCRTLAGAYPDTESGGEIVMMDPGGYGCLTITTPLSIIGTNGATSTATSGACIVITVPSSGVVHIRDLEITGANVAGTIGVQLNSGQLTLVNAHLKMLGTGIVVGATSEPAAVHAQTVSIISIAHADIINADIVGNTIGIETNGAGVNTSSGSPPYPTAPILVRLNGGSIIDNTTALEMINAAADGNGNCENTFWSFTTDGNPTVNVAGFTTFFSPSSSTPPYCNFQTYYSNTSSPAPN
jgi:hypothetical protein